jgi:hypothetical protein
MTRAECCVNSRCPQVIPAQCGKTWPQAPADGAFAGLRDSFVTALRFVFSGPAAVAMSVEQAKNRGRGEEGKRGRGEEGERGEGKRGLEGRFSLLGIKYVAPTSNADARRRDLGAVRMPERCRRESDCWLESDGERFSTGPNPQSANRIPRILHTEAGPMTCLRARTIYAVGGGRRRRTWTERKMTLLSFSSVDTFGGRPYNPPTADEAAPKKAPTS